jgi:hypothetical protein
MELNKFHAQIKIAQGKKKNFFDRRNLRVQFFFSSERVKSEKIVEVKKGSFTAFVECESDDK